MDMKQWGKEQISAPTKKALPILTFPAAEMMGITTKELIYSPELQANAMMYIHDHTDMAAVLAFMDLSVEAEVFGSKIVYSDDEVPTVVGSIIDEDSNVDLLEVPDPREGRTGVCIEGIRKIAERVNDKPVIAGNIGPFSLAGRLMDVNEVMFLCYDEPELVRFKYKCREVLTPLVHIPDYFRRWKETFPEVDRKVLSSRAFSLEEKCWFALIHLRLYHPVKRITGWFRNHRRSDS